MFYPQKHKNLPHQKHPTNLEHFSEQVQNWEYPPPHTHTLAGKVGAPPTLTKIEKVGVIRGVSVKRQLFMCLKRPPEVDPSPPVVNRCGIERG